MVKIAFKLILNSIGLISYIGIMLLILINYFFYDKEPTNMQILIFLMLHISINSIESVFPDEKNS